MADESCGLNPAMIRRKKIAVSIIFSLPEKEEAQRDFQDFFFSHFPLFESHMSKLKSAIEMVMSDGIKLFYNPQWVGWDWWSGIWMWSSYFKAQSSLHNITVASGCPWLHTPCIPHPFPLPPPKWEEEWEVHLYLEGLKLAGFTKCHPSPIRVQIKILGKEINLDMVFFPPPPPPPFLVFLPASLSKSRHFVPSCPLG